MTAHKIRSYQVCTPEKGECQETNPFPKNLTNSGSIKVTHSAKTHQCNKQFKHIHLHSPETNMSPLKIQLLPQKERIIFQPFIFRNKLAVSFRECTFDLFIRSGQIAMGRIPLLNKTTNLVLTNRPGIGRYHLPRFMSVNSLIPSTTYWDVLLVLSNDP